MLVRALTAATFTALATAAVADVNIYSYRQVDLIQPLMDQFTKDTGIKVNIAFLNKGMVERLQAEGKRSPADLVLTTDSSRLAALVAAGVTQPVQSNTLTANVPAAFRDPDNQWFGLTSRARVVYAARDRVADGEITTYEDLADPKWKGRICTRSGTHAYNIALIAGMIHHHGEDDTQTWLDGVKANLARKPQGNDRAQVKAIWAGECDISLGNTYYMGAMLTNEDQKPWADAVRIVFPTFENAGTHVNLSGMAMTKAAPNREDALKLMEWLTTAQAQEIYASKVYEYPVAPGSSADAVVAEWGSFTPDDVNLMDLAKLRPAALKLVETADFDG